MHKLLLLIPNWNIYYGTLIIFRAHHGCLLFFKEQKMTRVKTIFAVPLYNNTPSGFVGGKGRIVINYMSHQTHNWALYSKFHPQSRFKHPLVTYYDKEDLESNFCYSNRNKNINFLQSQCVIRKVIIFSRLLLHTQWYKKIM